MARARRRSQGPGNLRALSKVSEEASSLEKQSSGETSSGNTAKGPGLVTDRDGRQSTSMVLGNIHEQVLEGSQWWHMIDSNTEIICTRLVLLHSSMRHLSRPLAPSRGYAPRKQHLQPADVHHSVEASI